ncbi:MULTISPECIES: flotillin family protein [unclassified Coleofasciculus]|uniref:flotillin family protein n=1 Tax=unclassified Coleofasciculus TaxID=2692782 RepID=UPI0018804E15|nr:MULTISPECIES: flotillin family protein [unclassified Coleofasciculus]MBE9125760.1 flotillin family protein [Coleofasciculus sp. LEGE 07081]MBE9147248.1 flotillin family protein [Coleofasciculus sp. LEGE 07092]
MDRQKEFQSFFDKDVAVVQVAQVDPNLPTGIQKNDLQGQLSTGLPIALSLFGILLLIWFLNTFMCICKPNEVLILSGRKQRTKEGQQVGYRVVFGGRAIRIPIVETIKRMDLTVMPVPVEVRNAYSKGGTPLNIQAIANVKVSSDPAVVGNAIERFLDRDRSELTRVARETLEGNLRGVVATLTPEQLNEDRLRFAERIAQDVSRDLSKLGLQLDTLKIQSVSDDVDYLSSIGRRQIALIVRDAEIAESNAVGEAERIEADCQRQAEVSKTQASTVIQQRNNDLRKIKAELEQQARSEEERSTVAAKEARAKAEQQLQTIRAKLERLRLEADKVLPAEAQRQAQELQARGQAAPLAENAQAAALVNTMLAEIWQDSGTDASELFLIQQIEMVLREAAQIPSRLHLEQINVIDNGDGKSIASLVNAYPEILRQFLDQVDQTLGIDVAGTLNRTKVKSLGDGE